MKKLGLIDLEQFKVNGGELLAQWLASASAHKAIPLPKDYEHLNNKNCELTIYINEEEKCLEFVFKARAIKGIARIGYT